MTNSAALRRLKACVPVSTAAALVQKNEMLNKIPEELTLVLLACDPGLIVAVLIHHGWTIGCDGELLPPSSFWGDHA